MPRAPSRALFLLPWAAAAEPASAPARPVTAREAEFFETRVRPVLAENCFRCHGPKKQMSGLRLDSREALLTGGENGVVVMPGEPEKSALVKAVRPVGELKM